ncbi:hypothetical protein GCK72_021530 [Caenorhabditis remanei]|uniref:Uncharacterized protein n=1 Tax=Caenorhabditis remanei TaxID=31234 RepID=A0A6A5GJR5_CAERE|nr:hypothetical protein GCK72_021530 [Caenorhabditis remanei]KAF1754964.1 hypothetical protein GCK72_021530 [Caenorhabditis remanei]
MKGPRLYIRRQRKLYCHDKFVTQETQRKEAEESENRSKLPVPFIEPPKEPAPSSACVKALSEIFPALKRTEIVDPVPKDVYLEGLKIAMEMKLQEPVGTVSVSEELPNPDRPISVKDHSSCSRRKTHITDRSPSTTLRLCCDPTCKEPLVTLGFKHPYMTGERCCSKCYQRYRLLKQKNVPWGPFKSCVNPSCERLTEKEGMCRFCFETEFTAICAMPDCNRLLKNHTVRRHPDSGKPVCLLCYKKIQKQDKVSGNVSNLAALPATVCFVPQEPPNPSKLNSTTLRLCCDPTCKEPLVTLGFKHPYMTGERCCRNCYHRYRLRKQNNVPWGPFKPCANTSCERLTGKKALCRFCFREQYKVFENPSTRLPTTDCFVPFLDPPSDLATETEPSPHLDESFPKLPGSSKPVVFETSESVLVPIAPMIHPLLETSEVCITPIPLPATILPSPELSQRIMFAAPEPFTVSPPEASPATNQTFQLIGETYSFLTRPDPAFLERSAVTQEARKDFPAVHDPNYYSSVFNTRGLSTPGLVATPVPLLSLSTLSKAPQPESIAVQSKEPPNFAQPISVKDHSSCSRRVTYSTDKFLSTALRLCCDPSCKQPLATLGYSHPFMIGERCCRQCYKRYKAREQYNVPWGPSKPCANPYCERLTEKKAMCRFCSREQDKVSGYSSTLPGTDCSVLFSNPPSDAATETEPTPHLDESFPKLPGKPAVLEVSGPGQVTSISMSQPATILPIPEPPVSIVPIPFQETPNPSNPSSTTLRLCCDLTCKRPLATPGYRHPFMTAESKCYNHYFLRKQRNVPYGPFKPCANPSCKRLTEKKALCRFCYKIKWNKTEKCAMPECNRILKQKTVKRHPDSWKPVCITCHRKIRKQDKDARAIPILATLPATDCYVSFSNPSSDLATGIKPSSHLDEPFSRSSKPVILEVSGSDLVPILSVPQPITTVSMPEPIPIAPEAQPDTILPIPEISPRNLFAAPEPLPVSKSDDLFISSPTTDQTFQLIGDTYNIQTSPDTAFSERSVVTQEARKDAARVLSNDPIVYSSMFNTRGLSTPGLVATPVPLLSPPTSSTAPQPVSIAVTDEHLCGGPSSSPEQFFNPYILPFHPVLPGYPAPFLRPMSPIMKHPLFGYTPETNSQQVSYWPPSQIPFPKKETTEDSDGEFNSDK